MAGNGPPPQPLEQRRARGNPGRRPLPAERDTFALTRIPATPPRKLNLGRQGRAEWVHIAMLPWVGASDAAALVNLCQTADLVETLRLDVEERGPAYEVRGRWLSNPSVAKLLEARKALAAMQAAFGLTPADRARQGIAEVKAASKMDEFMERRAARLGNG